MPLKKEDSGRRSVAVEVEVPGTPEQVWQAIATGPGVSSWFVPSQSDGREGGEIVMQFGPGMEVKATITSWDPPRRLSAESPGYAPGMPPMATEWIVEARGGGNCIVRVVHSLFASTDDWDDQLTSTESGWPSFFRILRLYLMHFSGLPIAGYKMMAPSSDDLPTTWDRLTHSLGLTGLAVGQQLRTASGVPTLAGVIEQTDGVGGHPHHLILRLDEPTTGIVSIIVLSMGMTFVVIDTFLYGDRAASIKARDEQAWQAWVAKQYPA